MTKSRMISDSQKSIALHGVPKSRLGEDRRVIITSIGTERTTIQAERRFLEWRTENGLNLDGPFLKTEVVEFFQNYAELHSQADLDAARMALACFHRDCRLWRALSRQCERGGPRGGMK